MPDVTLKESLDISENIKGLVILSTEVAMVGWFGKYLTQKNKFSSILPILQTYNRQNNS